MWLLYGPCGANEYGKGKQLLEKQRVLAQVLLRGSLKEAGSLNIFLALLKKASGHKRKPLHLQFGAPATVPATAWRVHIVSEEIRRSLMIPQ